MTDLSIYTLIFLFAVYIGNLATTIYYREPRNITIFGFDKKSNKPPFCSKCLHSLRFYEYLPILGWFSTFGKCNYCKAKISKSYTAIEFLTGIISIILYYLMGMNLELFFLYFVFAVFVILNFFIYIEHKFASVKITLGIIILGMIYRTFQDHEIFGWMQSFAIASILSILIMKRKCKDATLFIHLILPASIWIFSKTNMIFFAIFFASAYFAQNFFRTHRFFYPICLACLYLSSLTGIYIST